MKSSREYISIEIMGFSFRINDVTGEFLHLEDDIISNLRAN